MAARVLSETLSVFTAAKWLKQTILLLLCHANAVVGHLQANCATAGLSFLF